MDFTAAGDTPVSDQRRSFPDGARPERCAAGSGRRAGYYSRAYASLFGGMDGREALAESGFLWISAVRYGSDDGDSFDTERRYLPAEN